MIEIIIESKITSILNLNFYFSRSDVINYKNNYKLLNDILIITNYLKNNN